MIDLTGSDTEFEQLKKSYNLSRVFAQILLDSMLEPLVAKEEFRRRFEWGWDDTGSVAQFGGRTPRTCDRAGLAKSSASAGLP